MSQLLNPAYRSHTVEGVLETHTCGECGVTFAMPELLLNARRKDGQGFYCPNGHCRVFTETEAQRLQRKLEGAQRHAGRLAAERDQLEASNRAQRAATTRARNQRDRLKTRARAGVCPCCNRTFKQLAAHMTAKHPDYRPDGEHA